MKYTYRFEVRGGGFAPEFTDDALKAIRAAFNRSEVTNVIVTVIDNDNPCPLCRIYKGVAELLQPEWRQQIIC